MNVTATNEWYTVLNNQDFKTSFELILNDLFTCWNFRFVFDPRLNDLQLLELELIHFAFLFVCLFVFFMETNNTTVFGKSKSVKSPSLESKACFDHRKSKVRLKQKSKLRWLSCMFNVGFSLLIYDKFISVDWKDKSVRGTHTLTIGIKGIELRFQEQRKLSVINVGCPYRGFRVTWHRMYFHSKGYTTITLNRI